MYSVRNAKYIRIPKNTQKFCSQLYIYVGGVLKKSFFISPGSDNGFIYYPLYKFGGEEVVIDVSHAGLLEKELMLIM